MNYENIKFINDCIKKQGLEICVVSYGGSGSNQLVNKLLNNKLKCRTQIWHDILCHYPKPFINNKIKFIYIFRNPVDAFLSMKKRNIGTWDLNQQKLSINKNIELSDENLLKLMISQFYNWTTCNYNNILIIYYEELFNISIVNKLSNFLNIKINFFPIIYKTKLYQNISYDYNLDVINNLFEKYKKDIDYINNFGDKIKKEVHLLKNSLKPQHSLNINNINNN